MLLELLLELFETLELLLETLETLELLLETLERLLEPLLEMLDRRRHAAGV